MTAPQLPEARLREIAEVDEVAVAISAANGAPSRSPSWDEVRAMASELLAARETIERVTKRTDSNKGWTATILYDEACAERDAARAEVSAAHACIGTIRDSLGCEVRNVKDVSMEQHSREIAAAARAEADMVAKQRDELVRAAENAVMILVEYGEEPLELMDAIEAAEQPKPAGGA